MIDDRHTRILIADDDPGIRRMLAVSLEKQGYSIAEARDGSEALTAMHAGEADLVLLDLRMPKVTGWQVLTERAAAPDLRKIPIIVITADRGEGVANLPKDGLCALLTKPFDLQTLHALVKSYLLRAEGGAQLRPT